MSNIVPLMPTTEIVPISIGSLSSVPLVRTPSASATRARLVGVAPPAAISTLPTVV